jgi:hypothetical protein
VDGRESEEASYEHNHPKRSSDTGKSDGNILSRRRRRVNDISRCLLTTAGSSQKAVKETQ